MRRGIIDKGVEALKFSRWWVRIGSGKVGSVSVFEGLSGDVSEECKGCICQRRIFGGRWHILKW